MAYDSDDFRSKLHPRAVLTYDEYKTRAMLLGYEFSVRIHAFFKLEENADGGYKLAAQSSYVDADTLLPDEVNSFEKRQDRRNHYVNHWNEEPWTGP